MRASRAAEWVSSVMSGPGAGRSCQHPSSGAKTRSAGESGAIFGLPTRNTPKGGPSLRPPHPPHAAAIATSRRSRTEDPSNAR